MEGVSCETRSVNLSEHWNMGLVEIVGANSRTSVAAAVVAEEEGLAENGSFVAVAETVDSIAEE